MAQASAPGRLHTDLVELLEVTRAAERDLYAILPAETRDATGTIGSWSAKDVLAHLGAWRAIEARRLQATARNESFPADDPDTDEQINDSNARLHAERAGWSWDDVDAQADASIEALQQAIALSNHDVLCECDGTVAGIGANGANHAMAHLSDVARLAATQAAAERYHAFAHELEAILARRHLRPRDSGVMLYNIACHHAITGDLDEARRLLQVAFSLHPVLRDAAPDDPDLEALRPELPSLS
jgi:hypothetical protein